MSWERLPDDRRRVLAAGLPALPPLERIRIRPHLPWWTRLAPIRVGAIAFPRTVFGMEIPPDDDPAAFERLAHELCHVEQWRRLGRLRFAARYAGAYLRNRARGLTAYEAYHEIPLEREAREMAAVLRREVERGS